MLILKIVVISIVLGSLAQALFADRDKFAFATSIWKQITIRLVLECIGVIIIIITSAVMLNKVSFLAHGWGHLLFGRDGNIMFSPFDGNYFIMIAILLLLFLAFPQLARSEEKTFRENIISVPRIIGMSILFGLVHVIMGITVATALSITWGGLFFAYKYYSAFMSKYNETMDSQMANAAGLNASTVAHTTYNSIIAVVVLIGVIVEMIQSF